MTSQAATQIIWHKLTDKGRETMRAIGNQELSFFDEGIVEHSGIWGQCLTQEMGHKSSGVINQLKKLGLFETSEGYDEIDAGDWWALTALGAEVANELANVQPPVFEDEGINVGTTEVEDVEADLDDAVEAANAAVGPVTGTTAKVGKKWTYLYDNGELIAELRNDQLAVIKSYLGYSS